MGQGQVLGVTTVGTEAEIGSPGPDHDGKQKFQLCVCLYQYVDHAQFRLGSQGL